MKHFEVTPENFTITNQQFQITSNFLNKHLLKKSTYWIQALQRSLRLFNFRKFVSELTSKTVTDLEY